MLKYEANQIPAAQNFRSLKLLHNQRYARGLSKLVRLFGAAE